MNLQKGKLYLITKNITNDRRKSKPYVESVMGKIVDLTLYGPSENLRVQSFEIEVVIDLKSYIEVGSTTGILKTYLPITDPVNAKLIL